MKTLPHLKYDIRTRRFARETLAELSGVPLSVWINSRISESRYRCIEDYVADIIESHGCLPSSCEIFDFIFFHVTTSANGCSAIRKYGLMSLKQVYLSIDSELRFFFDQHDIKFDLDSQYMIYHGQRYDISFGPRPKFNTEAYSRWSIGRRFYYDFATDGFLWTPEQNPYAGRVHERPEILMHVDSLLGLNLSRDWRLTHDAYEIVAKVSGENIVHDVFDQSDKKMVIYYLAKALIVSFREPQEQMIKMKNHTQIPPSDILEILPLQRWENDTRR